MGDLSPNSTDPRNRIEYLPGIEEMRVERMSERQSRVHSRPHRASGRIRRTRSDLQERRPTDPGDRRLSPESGLDGIHAVFAGIVHLDGRGDGATGHPRGRMSRTLMLLRRMVLEREGDRMRVTLAGEMPPRRSRVRGRSMGAPAEQDAHDDRELSFAPHSPVGDVQDSLGRGAMGRTTVKRVPPPGRRPSRHLAAVLLHDAARDGHAEADAARLPVGEERLEDARPQLLRDADAGVVERRARPPRRPAGSRA